MLTSFILFIGLLIAGRMMDELQWYHIALCVLIAVGALLAFPFLHWQSNLGMAVLSVMNVVLILIIFKGDIQI